MFDFTTYTPEEVQLLLRVGRHHKTESLSDAQKKLLEIKDRIYLFDGIEAKDVGNMTRNVRFIRYKEGDTVMEQGDESDDIYFLLNGLIDVFVEHDEAQVPVGQIQHGALFGEMSFITGNPRSATMVTVSGEAMAIAFQMSADEVDDSNALDYAQLFHNIAHSVANKLEACNERLLTGQS